jgi:hypothetical protein
LKPSKKKDLIISRERKREERRRKDHTKALPKDGGLATGVYRYYDGKKERRKKEMGTHVHNEPAAWKRKDKERKKSERPSKFD